MLTLPAAPKGKRPTRLPLTPAGEFLYGKDGRMWRMPDPLGVLRALRDRVVILDENHSTYLKAGRGESAPAMARLSDFTIHDDGSIWAETVEWTARGGEVYDGGDYLGLSPVVIFDPSVSPENSNGVLGDVIDIHSVALVNDPNLPMPALNAREIMKAPNSKDPQTPATPAAVPESAPVVTPPAAVAPDLSTQIKDGFASVIEVLKALVPAPVVAPVQAAANASDVHLAACNAACELHIKNAKLPNTPAARAHFLRQTKDAASLAEVSAYYDEAPPIVATNAAELTPPASGNQKTYSADEIKICKMFGRKPEDLDK